MNLEDDDWPVVPEPTDDERVLRERPGPGRNSRGIREVAYDVGRGTIDYAEAVTARDEAWWEALSAYEREYALLRALETAAARGAPLHLARCVHHLHDLLSGLDAAQRAWLTALLQRIGDVLVPHAGATSAPGPAVRLITVLAYLAEVHRDVRFTPPLVLPVGLVHRMYPQGVSPERLREALDRQHYPHGKPLPVCPLCEPAHADPADPLTRAVAALSPPQRRALTRLGVALALEGEAPDLAGQLDWVTGATPVPAPYHAALERAYADERDTCEALSTDMSTSEHG